MTPQPVIRDKLIQGSQAEKEYLKARKGKSDEALAQVEQVFITALARAGFPSIADYHAVTSLYGHWWRTLYPASYPVWTVENMPEAIKESIETGKDIFAYTLYDRTIALVPDISKTEELVNVGYCQRNNVDIVPYLGSGGCYVTEAGNFGILLIFNRPALAEGVEQTLKEVMQAVLLEHYQVKTYLETNELMTKQFIAHPNGVKIWGDSFANLGRVVMVVGALTLEFDTPKVKQILKKRPDHPEIKEPHGLNDLLGRKLDPKEVFDFVLAEWLKQTKSVIADTEWQTRLYDRKQTAT